MFDYSRKLLSVGCFYLVFSDAIKEGMGWVGKCSRMFTLVNSLIDQLHHCVVGTC